MPRVRKSVKSRNRRRRILKLAKGFRGTRSRHFRVAKQAVTRAMTNSYRDRKVRSRQFRRLWISRINAEARNNDISYSRLMHGLKLAGVEMNRKVLAEMAVSDKEAFASVVNIAKAELDK